MTHRNRWCQFVDVRNAGILPGACFGRLRCGEGDSPSFGFAKYWGIFENVL